MGRLRSWLRKDRGAALPEYAMIVGVLGLGLTYGIQTIDEGLEGNYQNDVNDIEAEDYAPTTVDTTATSTTDTTLDLPSTTLNTTTTLATSSTLAVTTTTLGDPSTTLGVTSTTLATTTTTDPCLTAPAALATQDLSYDSDASKYYAKQGFAVTNSCSGDSVSGAIVSWTNYTSTWSCITDAAGYCETPAYLRNDTSSPITWGVVDVQTPNGWTGSPTTFVMAHP